MHRLSSWVHQHRRRATDRGAIAVIVSLTLTMLLIGSAMVLDFGLVRVDRQVNKSAADAAATAGLYGLGGQAGAAHPYRAICGALQYLQTNHQRFSAVSAASGTWTDGAGNTPAAASDLGFPCGTGSPTLNRVCSPTDSATWARYVWNGTYQGKPLRVIMESGYKLNGSGWPEEGLAAVVADSDDGAGGCRQLAVTITQHRKPGLGSLATSSDLVSHIRTVGRVEPGPGEYAPAMLLLKQTGCPILSTGGSGGGSYIHVYGARSLDGRSQPGTIHADTGSGCSGSTNNHIFWGRAADGIVTYAAPLASGLPDPTKPGSITSVAGANGVSPSSTIIRDASANVYTSSALDEASAPSAAKGDPAGRSLVTRKPIDDRYLTGVEQIVDGAEANVFSLNGTTAASTFTVVTDCNPSGDASGILAGSATKPNLFIDCTEPGGYKGEAVIDAPVVVFAGRVNPSGALSMPNTKKAYIFGRSGSPAIDLSTGKTFSMHTNGNLSGTDCSRAFSPNRAVLVIRDGEIKQNGGLLQLCRTSVFMMGGEPDGCLPASGYATTPLPMPKPCRLASTPTEGTGQLSQTGGRVDWTAPNQYDAMTDAVTGVPDPTKAWAWVTPDGPEDLAFWSESGVSSSATFNMAGGGDLDIVGVYMVPNADPFIISGGAHQDLTNAQYIATSIALNGNGTSISMRVDPNAGVTVPALNPVGLVR